MYSKVTQIDAIVIFLGMKSYGCCNCTDDIMETCETNCEIHWIIACDNHTNIVVKASFCDWGS